MVIGLQANDQNKMKTKNQSMLNYVWRMLKASGNRIKESAMGLH